MVLQLMKTIFWYVNMETVVLMLRSLYTKDERLKLKIKLEIKT